MLGSEQAGDRALRLFGSTFFGGCFDTRAERLGMKLLIKFKSQSKSQPSALVSKQLKKGRALPERPSTLSPAWLSRDLGSWLSIV